jgi:hypothetical protein
VRRINYVALGVSNYYGPRAKPITLPPTKLLTRLPTSSRPSNAPTNKPSLTPTHSPTSESPTVKHRQSCRLDCRHLPGPAMPLRTSRV